MKKFERFLSVIDLINGWVGRIVGHLLIPMMFIMSYEVIMRYVFNRPTLWAMEINQYLFCILIALCGGHVLLNKGHISVDIFYGRFGERTRAIFDLLTSPLFFLFIILLIWQTFEVAIESSQFGEHSEMGNIPVYPVHIILVVGVFLMVLQGFAKFARDLAKVVIKRPSTQPEKEAIVKGAERKS